MIKITPTTTVAELLAAYPELEEKLISLAPPFKKLRNPFLRKSIGKIATLRNIASVGNIPLNDLIDRINLELGLPVSSESFEDEDYFRPQPSWFSSDKIKVSLVEGESGDKDKMTVVAVLKAAKDLGKGEIIELVTTFLPAPGIDTMRAKGYATWTKEDQKDTMRTYFLKDQ